MTSTVVDGEEKLALKPFLLAAVLWLPLSFVVWFALRALVTMPVIELTAIVFANWMPDLVQGIRQEWHTMYFSIIAPVGVVPGLPTEKLALDLELNVLPYCYGIAVLMGLSIASPISWARTFFQVGVGFVVLTLVETFGVVGEVVQRLAFHVQPAVMQGLADGYAHVAPQAAAQAAANVSALLASRGISPEVAGVWYQFGFLILPSVSAVILWILFNRRFIEGLSVEGEAEEPKADRAV